LAKTYVFKLKSGIKIPKIPVPEIELSRLKTPNFDIKKFLISEYKGLKQEIKDLFDLLGRSVMSVQSQLKRIGNIRIEFPKIEIPQITFKIPEFKLPELKLSLPKIPKRAEVKTPKVFEAEVKLPENPLINFNFDLVAHLRTSLKSLYSTVIRILLWPFKTIYRVIKAIFSIEIRFRLFSFRTFLLIAFIIGLYLGTAFYFIVWRDLPRIEALSTHEPRQTTTIYDRKGNILYRLYDDEDRTIVPLESIPRDFINATIAIEDEDFFTHNGLSVRGILRAAKKTFFEDDIEGGSTITQQLVKNSLLTSERTYERKAKEAVIAIEVERKYSKKQILEMYLNRISYGGTAYGIKSAAKRYFGKEPGDLTLAESSFLAGLPVAPSKYSPFAGNLEAGKERQRLVLDRMVASGFISQEAADTATEERLEFKSPVEKIIAPHFVNYVISELENKYGQLMVAQGGLDVFTSIDMELQTELENIVEIEVSRLARNNVSNGAALITDPKTGEVLAMVGSTNYWDTSNDGNVNITISPRQPGSSIKPLTYSLALENGYTLSSILDDTPVVYKLPGQKDYKPVNYDGRFHGRVTIRQALANSYNVPAVKMLDKLGVSTLVEHGQKMGITTWNDPSRFGLSLTLGAGEVKMTDMAVLYGVFANQGYKRNLNPILKIYDAYGNVSEENDCVDFLDESPSILTRRAWFETNALASTVSTLENKSTKTCQKEKVLSEFTSYMISNTLSDNRARASAFGANSELNITKRQFAVKTGTTNNEKDNWAIGYNDDFVVVTWVGNNYNEPMRGLASGYVGSSTIWRKGIDYLIENRDMAQVITRPAGLIEVDICPLTNTLACSGCPNVKQLFEKGKEPQVRCDPKVIEEMLKNDEEKENEEGQDENSKASDNQD
jgi:1A family penicillin-binding protein